MRAFQGPWNRFPSTRRDSKQGKVHSQLGSECILFRRMLKVWSLSNTERDAGIVEIPVESTTNTRSDVRWAKNSGITRSGFAEMFNSSKQEHEAKAGESEARKFAEMSRAKSVELIWGMVFVRKVGTEFGVLEPPTNRCVVPEKKKKNVN